jgi:hypothetical protein
MRVLFAALSIAFALVVQAPAQTCTGLCLQQVSCPAGQTTSITGTVYAPNGVDPLPNVLVYIPNAAVAAFTPGVSCPVVGQPPSGSPLVGVTTAFDGTFTLTNVPVGTNIPLVIETGRWRRQVVVPSTTSCTNTAFSTRMPKNQTEGDIPKIAIATGSADQVECVLRKVGIDDSEFTDPSGTGRINLFAGNNSAGAVASSATPSETTLMGNAATLNQYDVLMLPCQGGEYTQAAQSLANLVSFANAGGRVYSSHYSYVWMYNNPPFNTVVNWAPNQTDPKPDPGTATVDTSFSEGQTLAQWLQLIGASTTQGQIGISTLRQDFKGVVAPTQSWLALNDTAAGNPVMQFVFDTPVATTINQCGRVLFNEYHVENPATSPAGKTFPAECPATAMNAQEKLLEFSLFELTSDGAAATLTPTSQDFGSVAVGFTSAAQTFTWTNNSTFPSGVTLLNSTGDFNVVSNNCATVAAGASCQIAVVFAPTAIGARTGTLNVGSSGTTLTATLTGTGTPALLVSTSSLTYGSQDVGFSTTQVLTVTNNASGPVAFPPLSVTGDFSATSNCPAVIPSPGSCSIRVTFTPTTTGPRTGTLSEGSTSPAYSGTTVALSGNGVDFTFAGAPGSGTVIAGIPISFNVVATPLAGFANPVTLTCTTNAVASTCTPASLTFTPSAPVTTAVTVQTTSKYTIVGYGGLGGFGLLSLLSLVTGGALWIRHRRLGRAVSCALLLILLSAVGLGVSGCSGLQPSLNSSYTAPGSYTYTVTATDGFLVHSTSYSLTVTAK